MPTPLGAPFKIAAGAASGSRTEKKDQFDKHLDDLNSSTNRLRQKFIQDECLGEDA